MKNYLILVLLFSSYALAHELSLTPYLKMHKSLVNEKFEEALEAHKLICDKELIHYKDEYKDCDKKFNGLNEVRESFKTLSKVYIENGDKSELKNVVQGYCPMVKASWLQERGKVENPYVDKSMTSCGALR